jgi:hypothetical protein
MNVVVWVVGEPGVGKTSVVKEFLGPLSSCRLYRSPKWTMGMALAAGHYTGGAFDGADTIPYNGVSAAIEVWKTILAPKYPLTFLDGDRFAYAGAIEMSPSSVRKFCVLLKAERSIAESRRQKRAASIGSELQNATWVRGRRTKSERFVELPVWEKTTTIDVSRETPSDVALAVRRILPR